MKKNVLVPATLIIVLLFLLFFKPFYGRRLRSFLQPQLGENAGLDLRLENEALKTEVAKLSILKSQASDTTSGFVPAMVYSRYPFNFKNELLVGAGRASGIEAGKPVLFKGALIGKVTKVFDDTALVQTIFDERFQLSVGVGNSGTKALLAGGLLPKLSLIPLAAPARAGDAIYSVSPDFPYGLPLGEVKDIGTASDHLFQEASLKIAYDVSEVSAVLIRR